jgi:hypothetical protein
MIFPNTREIFMNQAIIVTGNLIEPNTIRLDESVPFANGKVRVIIENLETSKRTSLKVLAEIRKRQQERNFKPSIKEDIDKYLTLERDSWE